MSNEVSKQEYLKRYLEGEKPKNKKKARLKSAKVSRLKIIDQNIDIKSIGLGEKDVDELDDEEKPVVAEVIDERPLEMKLKELYESSRWKKISEEGSASASQEREQKSELSPLHVKTFSRRSRHDSDSDGYVNMKQSHLKEPTSKFSKRQNRHDSDSDISPPRPKKALSSESQRKNTSSKHNSDSDLSPPRAKHSENREYSDADKTLSAKRKSNRRNSDSDISPPRQRRLSNSESDHRSSSAVKKKHNSLRNPSQPKISRRRHDSFSNCGSPRKSARPEQGSDSDLSPPRKNSSASALHPKSSSNKPRQDSESDLSPPRHRDEDAKGKGSKPQKTLSGLKAGLQDSGTLRREVEHLRKREKQQLILMDESMSGRNATTVVRDRSTGLKRDLEQERKDKDEENKKNQESKKKYMEWGKGVVQTQSQMEKLADDLYEMSKPLARYEDDADLDAQLKAVIHEEDPMAAYIRKKKGKDKPIVPVYNGPPAPPNRYNIVPGYRWDGVDRSNGFEKRYFEKVNSSKAIEEESYLWSIQDM